MTAAALRAAQASGARRACLDASDAGARLYRRLGFAASYHALLSNGLLSMDEDPFADGEPANHIDVLREEIPTGLA